MSADMTEFAAAAAQDARLRADALADAAVARIFAADGTPPRWEAIALVEREMAGWLAAPPPDLRAALSDWSARHGISLD